MTKNGQYTLILTVEGKPFVLRAWPCDISTAGCSGAILDTSSRDYVAYQEAVNAKIRSELLQAGSLALGAGGAGIPRVISTVSGRALDMGSLYSSFSRNQEWQGLSNYAVEKAFQSFLVVNEVPDQLAAQITNYMSGIGVFSTLTDMYDGPSK